MNRGLCAERGWVVSVEISGVFPPGIDAFLDERLLRFVHGVEVSGMLISSSFIT